jgi:hypothetical protein
METVYVVPIFSVCTAEVIQHRVNMELDLLSLFGHHVQCTAVLIGRDPATPPPYLGSYAMELLVSQDRRHLFVTPWYRKTRIIC